MPKQNFSLTQKSLTYSISITFILILIFSLILFFNPLNILSNLFSVLALLFSLGVLASFIFYTLLRRDLKNIQSFTTQLNSLDLQSPQSSHLDIKSGDELESIASKINQTISQFQSSAKKLSEEKNSLISDKTRLSRTISSVADGIIGVDSSRRIMIFNKAAQTMTSLSEAEALGKELKEAFKIANKDGELSEFIYCPVESVSQNPTLFTDKNLIISPTQKDHTATVDLTTTRVSDAPYGLSCIITLHDVTQSKELEDMKFDFVSMAAHELRTPLTSIKGYLSVYMQENKDKLTPDQKMLLDSINSSSERLGSLVENLLNVSRIERGGLTINMQQVDWLDLLKNIVGDNTPKAREKQINLSLIQPEFSIPQVRADKIRIGEVISNLLSNAIKYTEPNGQIKVWVELNNKEITTHITDNGHGIPENMQPYLFNKFFRVNNKLEYGTKGNGLGLYITKSIVDLHHGKIWVKSEEGKGSTFSFSLPL